MQFNAIEQGVRHTRYGEVPTLFVRYRTEYNGSTKRVEINDLIKGYENGLISAEIVKNQAEQLETMRDVVKHHSQVNQNLTQSIIYAKRKLGTMQSFLKMQDDKIQELEDTLRGHGCIETCLRQKLDDAREELETIKKISDRRGDIIKKLLDIVNSPTTHDSTKAKVLKAISSAVV